MSRDFSLAGLLRLRQVQQDVAGAEAAEVNARMRDISLRRARVRRDLGDMTVEPGDLPALAAIGASRAAARSTLLELDALERIVAEQQERASDALATARQRAIALEKLEERHSELTRAEEVRADQAQLDELISVTWYRDDRADREEDR